MPISDRYCGLPKGLRNFEVALINSLEQLSDELSASPEIRSQIERMIFLAILRRCQTDIDKLQKLINWSHDRLKAIKHTSHLSLDGDVFDPN